MEETFYKALLYQANIGYALIKIIFNKENMAVDYQLLETDKIYEAYIGKKQKEIVLSYASSIYADDKKQLEVILDMIKNKKQSDRIYSEALKTWYKMESIQLNNDIYVIYLLDNRESHQQKEIYKELYQLVAVGKWVHNLSSGKLTWSSGVYEIFEKDEVAFKPTYKNFIKMINAEDMNLVKKANSDSIKNKTNYQIDYRVKTKSNEVKWISETCHNTYDQHGNLVQSIGVVQDITKRKHVENSLLDSENMHRIIFEKAEIGICTMSKEGKILKANQKFCDILGHTIDEIKLVDGYNVFLSDDEDINHSIRLLLSGEVSTLHIEKKYIKKNLSVISVDLTAHIMRDKKRKTNGFIVSISDVTAKNIYEKQLIREEYRLRRAQEIAHVGNWELDLKSNKLWGSIESFRIYGLKRESEYLPLEKIKKLAKYYDRDRMNQSLTNLIKYNKPYDIIFTIVKDDTKEERTIHSVAELEEINGDPYKVVGVIEDITEQKKLEYQLKESIRNRNVLLSNLPGMAYRCSFDRNWTMQYVSKGCYELTGYEPSDLIDNKKVAYNDLILSEFREMTYKSWERAVENKTFSKEEYQIKTAEGTIKWVWEQGQAIYDKKGDAIALEGFIADITERKEREKKITFLSYHDVLTGVFNRTFFDVELKRLDTIRQLPLSIIMGDINGLKMTNDVFGHAMGDKLLKIVASMIIKCCRSEDIVARLGGDEFCVILPNTKYKVAQKISERITKLCEKSELGPDCTIKPSISFGFATKTDENQKINSILREAEELMYKKKLLESQSLHGSVISSIRNTMAEKSFETKEHAERIVVLSHKVGLKLNLSESMLNELKLLATLHDIGKMSIDSKILNKQDRLTEEEWFEMHKHPEIGYRIARSSSNLVSIADYILTHHEHYDGTGYPQGLKGEDIPLISRILSVVDAYDAMTNNRPYRKALTKEQATNELIACSGSQFDEKIVKMFIESLEVI